jgi:hypothetical protein
VQGNSNVEQGNPDGAPQILRGLKKVTKVYKRYALAGSTFYREYILRLAYYLLYLVSNISYSYYFRD